MRACASTAAVRGNGAGADAQPVVLLDGVPEFRLAVRRVTRSAPLDVREVELNASAAVEDAALLARWERSEAAVVLPTRLNDEAMRWPVLATGRVRRVTRRTAAGVAERGLELVDEWTALLDRPTANVWWADVNGSLMAQRSGVMHAGSQGNRSSAEYELGGAAAHVLQEDGEAWTVKAALELVSVSAGLGLSLRLLPREIAGAVLLRDVDLARPLGEVLRRILEPYDLVVQREATREAGRVVERRAVRPMGRGRSVELKWAGEGQPLSDALRIETYREASAAQAWKARCDGWLVEATLPLTRGWSASLEGEADAMYGRSTSSDFASYANVFRYWVLNEDGRFDGAAFDLAGLFGEGPMRAQPVRLLPCVTLDDAGRPRDVMVEVSTDGGGTWSQWAGTVKIDRARAAVYLDDDVLPSTFLAAAKSGAARVRVTASVRSPLPVETVRWRGNAFAGAGPAKVHELGETFAFRRVDASSVHHEAVRAGQLQADERDERTAMSVWLADRLRELEERGGAEAGRGTVTLAGSWLMLRPGDRLMQAGGGGASADDHREAVVRKGVVVTRVRCELDDVRHGARTLVEVRL